MIHFQFKSPECQQGYFMVIADVTARSEMSLWSLKKNSFRGTEHFLFLQYVL